MNQILIKKKIFVVIILSFLTTIRIFIGNASFPFFNNVDEHAHFDLIVKYSHGKELNLNSTQFEQESLQFYALYGSPEYLARLENYTTGEIPKPVWSLNFDEKRIETDKQLNEWAGKKNHESFSPPIYYAVMGVWFNLGKLLSIEGGYLLYWTRLINVFFYLSLFWITYYALLKIFPGNAYMQFGILAFLAIFPQDVFYGINSDNLSPLFSLLAFISLLEIYQSKKSYTYHIIAGIYIACAFLVKISNLPLIFISGLLVFLQILKRETESSMKIFALSVAFSIPISIWFTWNYFNLGDITGTSDKVHYLGWTKKHILDIWDHPIFTFKGIIYFFPDLIKTFWRGELVWGLRVLASKNSDLFYLVSTILFVLTSTVNTFLFKSEYTEKHRFTNLMSIAYVFLSILFIIFLSMLYDFGNGFYPSKHSPFFTSGRLLIGALIPFLILYLDGLRVLIQRISKRINLLWVITIVCIFISHYEITSIFMIIKSKYNWFHL